MPDELADYVLRAGILDAGEFPNRGAHKSYLLVLEGGLGVLAKPEDEIENGGVLVRCEVAAWHVVCLLGWSHMMSVTVLRSIPSQKSPGAMVDASLHVLWPYNQPGLVDGLPEEDLFRAGVFDAVIQNADRHQGNWLAVLANGAPPRLKLVDHGYAFGAVMEPPNSPFFGNRHGASLTDDAESALKALLGGLESSALPRLLARDAVDAVIGRVQRLLENGALQLP